MCHETEIHARDDRRGLHVFRCGDRTHGKTHGEPETGAAAVERARAGHFEGPHSQHALGVTVRGPQETRGYGTQHRFEDLPVHSLQARAPATATGATPATA